MPTNVATFEQMGAAAQYEREGVQRAVALLKKYAPWFAFTEDDLARTVTSPLTTTVTAVETGASNVFALFIMSPAAATQDCYVQVFNATTGNVTLGTTEAIDVIACAAGKVRVALFVPGDDDDDLYATACSIAATTTNRGNTALATASQPTVWALSS